MVSRIDPESWKEPPGSEGGLICRSVIDIVPPRYHMIQQRNVRNSILITQTCHEIPLTCLGTDLYVVLHKNILTLCKSGGMHVSIDIAIKPSSIQPFWGIYEISKSRFVRVFPSPSTE